MINAMLHWGTLIMEVAGIVVIVAGAAISSFMCAREYHQRVDHRVCYKNLRARLGRSILLGLEFLVAADIIATVAVEPTPKSVMVLAGVVLIRTFLSFALETEIEGRLPWRSESK